METDDVVAAAFGKAVCFSGVTAMGGLRYESMADMPPGLREKYAAKQVAGKIMAKPSQATPVAAHSEKESKYHNVKVVVNGIRFDSKKEARRYLQLMDALQEGVISDLRLQQDFTLQEAYTTPDGERIRAIRYQADFTYKIQWAGYSVPTSISFDDLEYWSSVVERFGHGAIVVEDTKSRATKTPQYVMKYKMMADKGYIIREV